VNQEHQNAITTQLPHFIVACITTWFSFCFLLNSADASSVEGKIAFRTAVYKLLYERTKAAALQQLTANEGKTPSERDLEEVVTPMTNCFMESMARYPEKYQDVAYDAVVKGKDYLEANSAFEAALKVGMSADDASGRALRQTVIENVNFTRDCLNKLATPK